MCALQHLYVKLFLQKIRIILILRSILNLFSYFPPFYKSYCILIRIKKINNNKSGHLVRNSRPLWPLGPLMKVPYYTKRRDKKTGAGLFQKPEAKTRNRNQRARLSSLISKWLPLRTRHQARLRRPEHPHQPGVPPNHILFHTGKLLHSPAWLSLTPPTRPGACDSTSVPCM